VAAEALSTNRFYTRLLPKIPHSGRGLLMGGEEAARATMAVMKSIHALDRDHARAKRLVQVKFVCLPFEPTPPSAPALGWPARTLASLRDSITRVIGCLRGGAALRRSARFFAGLGSSRGRFSFLLLLSIGWRRGGSFPDPAE
jgi:hypothetical protein